MVRKLAPDDVQEASQKVLGDLEGRRFDLVRDRLIGELREKDLSGAFEEMAAAFPRERPKAVTPIGFYATTGTNGTRFDITYEYEFSKTWVVAQISWVRVGGDLRIYRLNVRANSASILELNAFTFKGKGAMPYILLLMGAAAATISIVALVKCIRTKGLRRKWLWIIFIIVGFGAFSLNWTTGQLQVGILDIQLLSFSGTALFGQAWIIKVSVPVGAVVFLEKLRKERKAREKAGGDAPPILT